VNYELLFQPDLDEDSKRNVLDYIIWREKRIRENKPL
jgi:hypothetical protein